MEITIDSLEQMCDLMCYNYIPDELHEKIMHVRLQLNNSKDKEFMDIVEEVIRKSIPAHVLRDIKQEVESIPLSIDTGVTTLNRDANAVLRDVNRILDEYIADYQAESEGI